MVAGAGISIGLAIGSVLFALLPPLIGNFWSWAACAALSAVCLAVVLRIERSSRWSLTNLIKGLDAERRVGEAIDYAITAENCAVAHSVIKLAKKVGDIDHLVATPKRVWVIETKYKKVHGKRFPEVLRRIAANVKWVREWAPAGTPVRGCLVLPFETRDFKKKNYREDEEEITVYTEKTLDTLIREMREEARGKRSLDEQIAKDIWDLGKFEAAG